ncbi:uncharacterized protein LOC135833333 [Planococcus citri]|uniref:uncharacterized protein LOC135833333 n=1 Tax=Planococcus citri TaxID=170843 RepID=UPI0031F88988
MLLFILLFNLLLYHHETTCCSYNKAEDAPIEVPELAIREPFVKPASPIFIQALSFEHLVEQSVIFFDRSLLIKEIFDQDIKVFIITMPNGFGKTMNLGMIQAFFEIQVDVDGNTIEPLDQTTHYRLFKLGEIVHRKKNTEFLKRPLLIATRHENFTNQYLGQYPVVYISFACSKGDTFDQVVDELKLKISKLYEEFYHLLGAFRKISSNPRSTQQQKERAENNIETFKKHAFKRSTLQEVQNSLAFLCEALYENYGKKVILLVDDYDGILNHTLFSDKFFSTKDEDLIIEFFKGLVTCTLIETNSIEKAILTGTILLQQGSLMPTLNNSKEFSIRHNELSSFYGCEDNLTENIFRQIGINELARGMIRAVRLGYRLNLESSQLSYDPLTLACNSGSCLVPRSYATFFHKFLDVVSFRNAYSGLVSSYTLPDINISDVHFDRLDFRILKSPPTNESTCGPFVKSAMKYLYATGFLTITNSSTGDRLEFQFVSEAILALMKGELLAYYDKDFKVQSDILHTYFSLMSSEFYDFSRNFESNCPNLELLMTKFYKILLDPGRIAQPDEELIHNSVNFLIIFFDRFKRLVTYGREMALFSDDYVLTVLESSLDEISAEEALRRAKNKAQSFRIYDNFNMLKFIGINVRQNGTVDILAENKFYRELFE